MKRTLACFCLALAAGALPASAGLDIYFIRHAETMGNVTLNYTEENQRTFSPHGLEQVAGVPAKLAGYRFDAILVSPTHRTRQTILPYLQANRLTAEIWPEVEECCCDCKDDTAPAAAVTPGEPVEIGSGEAAYFRTRGPDAGQRFAPQSPAESYEMLRRGCDLIRARFTNSESILVVTHSCSGGRMMEILLGLRPGGRFSPGNAALTRLRQGDDGLFELVLLNDKPVEPAFRWVRPAGERAAPGAPYRLHLRPRYYAGAPKDGYRLSWTLRNRAGETVAQNEESFLAPGRDAETLFTLEIPTAGAAAGDVWELGATIAAGGRALQSWTEKILFPSYVDLAGAWQIRASADYASFAETNSPEDGWLQAAVPGGWEAGPLPEYDGIAWYRTRFRIPADVLAGWGGRPLAVAFGAIDDADETFLNGTRIGSSGQFPPAKVTAWDQPRVYEFDRALLAEENLLAIRVSDWGGGGGVWRAPAAVGPSDELRLATELER